MPKPNLPPRQFPNVPVPKEINVRQFWNIDVIIQYDPRYQRLIIKKPSGQETIDIHEQDIR